MSQSPSHIAGHSVIFIGNECQFWTVADFVAAARIAQSLGIDTICPKRGNGTERWYGEPAHLAAEYQAVHAIGMGYLPFAYCYGPRFGLAFVDQECAILREMQTAIASVEPTHTGFVCADLEAEWNNRPDAAQRFVAAMRDKAGILYLTTWGDPVQQGWSAVISALRECVDAWLPQQYSDWLAAQEGEFAGIDAMIIEPVIDLTSEFGSNHPLIIVQEAMRRGQTTIWLWEYTVALANRQLTQDIAHVLHQQPVTSPVPPPPILTPVQPQPIPVHSNSIYTVQRGDTLSAIAARLGIGSWQDLYRNNHALIEQTARAHGYASSQNGNLIFPGMKLVA